MSDLWDTFCIDVLMAYISIYQYIYIISIYQDLFIYIVYIVIQSLFI